ncbi:PilW family protein [Aeromonas caviae]|uniref:PilW family protein n=1 Tax=Aeromonas caviae TaxID=648 RepID=UPI00191F85A9|nr:type II secretion system protein [Aeromonas caviae]MBL0554478.1 type II secretion system protein [Aeromonas caviae]MDH0476988.1 type II secretion system GspH family protein [Aeromonas caviae]
MGKPHSRDAAWEHPCARLACYRVRPGREGGFTLVELVMVILLLGVMATFSSQFIGIGTQIYGDASRREQLMSDARFALERLNREVRDAVPGSVRVEDEWGGAQEQGACLRFWPIATASRYLGSVVSTGLSIVTPSVLPKKNEDLAIVYPLASMGLLNQGCLQGSCTARVTDVGSDVSGALPLTLSNGFVKDSPGQRIYFANQQVLYCVRGGNLWRMAKSLDDTLSSSETTRLMAEHIRPAAYYFYREPAAFNQSEVGLRLEFEQRDERVVFHHKLETLNVP